VAEESIVLLKNENRLLPFDPSGMRKLAVVGPNAAVARLGGGGSSTVTPFQCVTPLQALEEKCRQHDIEVLYALGCGMPSDLPPVDRQYLRTPDGEAGIKAEYFDNPEMQGEPVIVRTEENVYFDWGGGAPDPSLKNNCFAARWTGQLVPETDGKYEIGLIAYDDMLCYVNGELLIECRPDPLAVIKTVTLDAQAGVPMDLRIEYFARNGWPVAKFGWVPVQDMQQAVDLAAEADAVVMVGGLSASYEGEGVDRRELCLPGRQDELIQKLLEVNPATAVVLVSGTPVTMEGWKDRVPALVEAWYPGQEGGFAIADVLFGDVNPSGKLTVTFPRQLEDNPSHGHYPGDREVRYTEGIYVGYRHYDKHQIEPLFPFGHGLSYTTFAYEDLQAEKAENGSVQVRCRIRNTGDCRGSEVVQLYVGDPESRLDRPPCELKAFRKMALDPGEDSVMEWELREEAFSYYDPEAGAWVLEPGAFHIMAGSSSRDIRKTIVIEM
jgi:beta-glucosidase